MMITQRVSMWLVLCVLVLKPRGAPGQRGGSSTNSGSGRSGGSGGSNSGDDALTVLVCAEEGTSAHYDEFLSGSGGTMSRWAGSLSGCPNHVNWAINPNHAEHNPTNESIPAYPMLFGAGGTTNLSSEPNTIGIMRNGVSLFSAWAADTVTSYETTAFYLEWDTFDMCGGHSTARGIYHYHNTPGCLQEQAMEEAGSTVSQHSPLLGWSYDGFPVYGQLGPGGVEMKMCGVTGADDTHCLDECNGYEAALAKIDAFKYRYYLSCGFDESYFPLTINCYRGCCPDGTTCSNKVEDCDDDAEQGYTADYTPESSSSLDIMYDAELVAGKDTLSIINETVFDCALYAANATFGQTSAPTSSPSTNVTITQPPEAATTSVPTSSPSAVADSEVEDTPAPSKRLDVDDDEDSSGAIPRSSTPPFSMLSSTALGVAIFAAFELQPLFVRQ